MPYVVIEEPSVLARTVRRAQLVAIAFGAVTFTAALVAQLSPGKLLRGYSDTAALTVFLLLAFAPVVVLPLVYLAAFWRSFRCPPVCFTLGRYAGSPAFATPVSPLATGPMFIATSMQPALAISVAFRVPELRWFYATASTAPSVILIVGALYSLFRPGYVRLTPEGLVFTRLGGKTVAWDALAPDGPTPADVHVRNVWIQVHRAAPGFERLSIVTERWQRALPDYGWYCIKLSGVLVDGPFLAHALRFYRDHPDARSSIGTPEGLVRVQNKADHQSLRA